MNKCVGWLIGTLCLQVTLAVQRCAEGHVVQGTGNRIRSFEWRHSLNAVLRLIWGQFTAQLIGQDVGLKN